MKKIELIGKKIKLRRSSQEIDFMREKYGTSLHEIIDYKESCTCSMGAFSIPCKDLQNCPNINKTIHIKNKGWTGLGHWNVID